MKKKGARIEIASLMMNQFLSKERKEKKKGTKKEAIQRELGLTSPSRKKIPNRYK
jgi:hypothetical protein